MVDAKDKEKVIEMIRDIVNSKKSQEKDMDISALIKSVAPNDSTMANNLPLLLMLMNSGKSSGNGMEKLTEAMSTIAVINTLSKMGGSDRDSTKDIIDYIDRKLESLQAPKEQITAEKIAQIVSSSLDSKLAQKQAEENNNKILTTLLQALTNSPKEAQPSLLETIKVVAELTKPQPNNNTISPLDALDRIGGMYQKIAEEKEENSKQMQELTAEYNERLMEFIKENRQNASVMDELKKSAQTVNGIKEFAKENLGLKDFTSAPKEGQAEPQWKTILDAVNNTLSTVLPVVANTKKPQKNPNLIDLEGEANRLYNKYKDYLPNDQISVEDFKAELQTNPNLEKTLDDIVKKRQAESQASTPSQQPVNIAPTPEQPQNQPQQESQEIIPEVKIKPKPEQTGVPIG
jgi:hypothetical protein